jgi:hypothetical protein
MNAEHEILDAVRAAGFTPRSAVFLGGWRTGRATYRVTLADGTELKARRHQGVTRGARAAEFTRALADPAFPAPLAVVGRVTIEAWVAGATVAECRLDRALIDDSAALLARLHAVSSLPGRRVRAHRSVAAVRERTARHLETLTATGIVDRRDRRAIDRVLRGLPPTAPRGLTHGDFCGENLVRSGPGLVCIDNEAVALGFLDEDIARTWSRWPMPAWAWSRFRAGVACATGRPVDPVADRAWQAVAAVRGAHRWTRARGTAGDAPVQVLRRVIVDATARPARAT